MARGADSSEIVLCRLEDIPDGKARGFDPRGRGEDEIFAVRRAGQVHVYRNWCPHAGTPLEFAKDQFLTGDGRDIMCYAHGAHFRVEDGACTHGPCLGDKIPAIPARVVDGEILITLPPVAENPL